VRVSESRGTVHHPLFARVYVRLGAAAERAGMSELRDEALAGLRGRVLEVGAGHGLNFPHYPPQVSEVVAIEPEGHLRDRARAAALEAPVPVTVMEGIADRLPAADGAVDAAVVCLVLCSVPDQRRALAELLRVVRPGGELRFLEHVRSADAGLARLQSGLDRWLWPRIAGGCHCARDTEAALRASGFEVEALRRFTFRPCVLNAPTSPCIVGVARRPAGPG
jgi:SAM-dependent methyltransferase